MLKTEDTHKGSAASSKYKGEESVEQLSLSFKSAANGTEEAFSKVARAEVGHWPMITADTTAQQPLYVNALITMPIQ